jgi:hypothetical protein
MKPCHQDNRAKKLGSSLMNEQDILGTKKKLYSDDRQISCHQNQYNEEKFLKMVNSQRQL